MMRARILIVEDEALQALALRRSIEAMGHEVVATLATGEDAVRHAEREHIDLVLMDINLKGPMTGTEAADIIRRSVDVPVIYLTAYSDKATLRNAGAAAPLAYLVKPYSDPELHAAIQVGLSRHAVEQERRTAEVAVRAREASLQDFLDGCPAVIELLDREGRYTRLNRAFEEVFGVARRTALGQAPADIPGMPWQKTLSEGDRRVIETGSPERSEETVETSGGSRRLLLLRFPLRHPDGTIYGIGRIAIEVPPSR